jgi:hypothetical protein
MRRADALMIEHGHDQGTSVRGLMTAMPASEDIKAHARGSCAESCA